MQKRSAPPWESIYLDLNVSPTYMKFEWDESPNPDDDMLPDYHFDYQQAKPNRFATRSGKKMTIVVLDEDVAEIFSTLESVNKALIDLQSDHKINP